MDCRDVAWLKPMEDTPQTLTDTDKGAALEAYAAGGPLDRATRGILAQIGIVPQERRQPPCRPWTAADIATVRRLHRSRGWSTAAIAAFLHRDEPWVRRALARTRVAPLVRLGRRT